MKLTSKLVLLFIVILAATSGCLSQCGEQPEPPITPTATFTPGVTASPTPLTPTATNTPIPSTETPTATATPGGVGGSTTTPLPPTPVSTPTPEVTATPVLLTEHDVIRGDTLWGIMIHYYPHTYFPMAVDVWGPILEANLDQIGDKDLIYPGQRLRVPLLRTMAPEN